MAHLIQEYAKSLGVKISKPITKEHFFPINWDKYITISVDSNTASKNYKKYAGDPNSIVYRSLLERKFMVYCDTNPDIISWASEELSVKYRSPIDQKVHR